MRQRLFSVIIVLMCWNLNDWATFSAIIIGSAGLGLSIWNTFFKDRPSFSLKSEIIYPSEGKGKFGVKISIIGRNKTIYIDKVGYKFDKKIVWIDRHEYSLLDTLPPGDSNFWQLPIDDIVNKYGEYPKKAIVMDKSGRKREVDMPKIDK